MLVELFQKQVRSSFASSAPLLPQLPPFLPVFLPVALSPLGEDSQVEDVSYVLSQRQDCRFS